MVLVDTSVWIRSLAKRPPYTAELDRLLGLEEVAGHELVYGELLIGDWRRYSMTSRPPTRRHWPQ